MTTVTFSGKSEAKGRNGYFHMAGAQATRLNMPNDTPYHISLYSSRPNDFPRSEVTL